MIMFKANQLLDATIVASLAISLSSAGATHMYKMLGPKIRVVVTKAVAIRAMVMVMVVVMVVVVGRPVVEPMLWMLISSRGTWLVSLKGINQDHLVMISAAMMRHS